MGSITVFPKVGPLHSTPTMWWCRARILQGIAGKVKFVVVSHP